MEVKDEYNSVIGFNVDEITSTCVRGWVEDEETLREVIDVHSIDTLSQFVSWHDDKNSRSQSCTQRILWTHKDVTLENVPFSLDRHIIRQCSFGKAHKRELKKNKIPEDHDYSQCKKISVQPSRKVGCTAKLVIRYVNVHIDYSGKDLTRRDKTKLLDELKQRLENDKLYQGEKRIYITLPLKNEHTNHVISPESVFSKRLHPKIIEKIHELVTSGITNIPLIKKTLKIFVDTEFFKNTVRPSMFDRSFYPLAKDIKNHVYTALVESRLAGLDQENLGIKIDEWKKEDVNRNFYFRPATVPQDSEENTKFLLVHQEQWQRRLLSIYGNTICLLDATYKTTKYSLPFFLLVVKTNVDYIPVAEFVVEDETSTTIREAIAIIKSWNPEWNPPYFMIDYCEAEINALEAEFPDCNVLQCAFHREQAWERWTKGEYKVIREDFLEKMRQLAYAPSVDDFNVAMEDLQSSDWFKENKSVQSYVENRWIKIKERWCLAFKDLGFHGLVTTTNGVETLNKSLKHSYLKLSGTGSLSSLFELVIKDFLQNLFQTYAMLNYRSNCNYKSYASGIPTFLHDRPRNVVEHCMKRICASEHLLRENVTTLGINEFCVKSGKENYSVCLGTEITFPYCSCEDFRKTYLPCKHFFAVFQHTEKGWDDMSTLYKDSPYLKIDNNVLSWYSNQNQTENSQQLNNEKTESHPIETSETQTTEDNADFKFYQRELLAEIKSVQNLVYNCTDIETLKLTTEKCLDIKTILSKSTKKEDGLAVRVDFLRKLPRKKRYQWSNLKRSGRKAQILRENTCKDKFPFQIQLLIMEQIADMKVGQLYFYNPAGEQHVEKRKILNSWREYINQYNEKFSETLVSDWSITTMEHKTQTDSYNCGVYCLMFAEKHLTRNFRSLLTISNQDLMDMRRRVAQELMLYEVFLTGCCPKCGFAIEDDEAIECVICKRSYHFKNFCIEEDLTDFGDSSEFTCRLCRINFWPVMPVAVSSVKCKVIEEEKRSSHPYSLRKNPVKKRRKSHWYELDRSKDIVSEHVTFKKKSSVLSTPIDLESSPYKEFKNSKEGEKLKAEADDVSFEMTQSEIETDSDENIIHLLENDEQVTGNKGITEEFYFTNLTGIIKMLYNIMNCTDETCDDADHYRHHEFIREPLEVYNRERLTHNFGGDIFESKTIEKIAMSLMDELLFNRYKDPKHPYSEGKITDIKKLSNTQLKGIFMKHGLLATSYLNSVCLKESLIWLIIMKEQCPYEKADEKCKKTEVCIKDILKEIKQRKR